jgi:hypothetical protein
MLAADRKKRHNFCEKKKPQKLRLFLRQLKQALCIRVNNRFIDYSETK